MVLRNNMRHCGSLCTTNTCTMPEVEVKHLLQMAASAALEDLLIGPVPPEVGAKADAASGDERSAEVVRILR